MLVKRLCKLKILLNRRTGETYPENPPQTVQLMYDDVGKALGLTGPGKVG